MISTPLMFDFFYSFVSDVGVQLPPCILIEWPLSFLVFCSCLFLVLSSLGIPCTVHYRVFHVFTIPYDVPCFYND